VRKLAPIVFRYPGTNVVLSNAHAQYYQHLRKLPPFAIAAVL
jgi:hypothetical protein